jgi:hypothetical protein
VRAALKAIAEHLQDELDLLGGARITVYEDYAYGVAAPYVVLQAPSLDHHDDESLSGPSEGEAGGTFTVTCVHVNTDGARWVADRVRGVLSPSLAPTLIPADSHLETLWAGPLGPVVVDRDVRLPNTNQHPGVAIEEYELSSQPADES